MTPHPRGSLAEDQRRLGLGPADQVMVHAGFSRVGPVLGGPDALVDALLDVVGPEGTVLSYQDWELGAEPWDESGAVREGLRDQVPPFDPATSRAARAHGILASTIGTRAGVRRSGNPGACVAALGARAEHFTAEHPLDYGYGRDSPFARLVAARGHVLMVGAPLDTITLLHHAEDLARIPGKHRIRVEYPLRTPDGGVLWRWTEEFDTSRPIVDGLEEDYFAAIAEDYLATGGGSRGSVGDAPSHLLPADGLVAFATAWLESRAAG